MKKIWKRVCTGILALTTILTALPITSVQAAETQYWTESAERVGHVEHLMNDGTIKLKALSTKDTCEQRVKLPIVQILTPDSKMDIRPGMMQVPV